jgi:hypothetical protein
MHLAGVQVADWRNPEDYEFQDLPAVYWAWEFLRRNPTYRQAWKEAMRWWSTVRDEKGEETSNWLLRIVAPAVQDPRHPAFGFSSRVLKSEFRERYGLAALTNPDTDRPTSPPFRPDLQFRINARPDFLDPPGFEFPGEEDPSKVTFHLGESEVVARFDLRFALEPQLRLCKQGLHLFQGHYLGPRGKRPLQRRLQPAKWRRYLRALDALESGAGHEKMADVFFALEDPDSDATPLKQVDNLLQQAKRMLEPEQYRKILLP